jgi:hypothetical protein
LARGEVGDHAEAAARVLDDGDGVAPSAQGLLGAVLGRQVELLLQVLLQPLHPGGRRSEVKVWNGMGFSLLARPLATGGKESRAEQRPGYHPPPIPSTGWCDGELRGKKW